MAPGPWRARAFAALVEPGFRRFLAGHLFSVFAFWMRIAAQGWLVYDLTGSKAQLGLVSAAGLLPTVLIAPLAGVWADRADKRRLLIGVALGTLLANLGLAAAILAGQARVLHVVVTAVLVGSLRAVEMPVRQAYVVEVAGRQVLGNALALQAGTFNLARVLGPTVAGLLLAAFGAGPCYALLALLSGGAALTLARLPSSPPPPRTGGESPFAHLVEGLRYVAGEPRLRFQMRLMGLAMLLTFTYTGMLPALAQDEYGLSERGYGVLMGLSGVGALAGALWVGGRVGHAQADLALLVRCLTFGGLAVAGLALAPGPGAAALPLLLAALFQVAFMASSNTLIQAGVPDRLRGRVMGLWVLVFGATAPLGSLGMGFLAERVGLRPALAGSALGGVGVVLLLGWRRLPPGGLSGPSAGAASDPAAEPPLPPA